jgi:hypothetical protein
VRELGVYRANIGPERLRAAASLDHLLIWGPRHGALSSVNTTASGASGGSAPALVTAGDAALSVTLSGSGLSPWGGAFS